MKNKVGIFGGSFDPFHFGHLNSMVTVAEHLGLDSIKAIPTFRTPMRPQTQGATPAQRFQMCQLGVMEHKDLIEVLPIEIAREGVSFTIDTIRDLQKSHDALCLIIGLDQFKQFDEWKEFETILKCSDLVVTSRPGSEFPSIVERFPPGIKPLVEDYDGRQALLKTGHTIHFIRLQDVDASATEIRKRIRMGQPIHHLVPGAVEKFIQEHHLYESISRDIGDFKKFTYFCANHLKEKGGVNIRAFDLTQVSSATDYTIVVSGTSTRHAISLAESLTKETKREYGTWPQSLEGQTEGRWIVIDYGALIIHSFYDFVRQEYRLEDLWKEASELSL